MLNYNIMLRQTQSRNARNESNIPANDSLDRHDYYLWQYRRSWFTLASTTNHATAKDWARYRRLLCSPPPSFALLSSAACQAPADGFVCLSVGDIPLRALRQNNTPYTPPAHTHTDNDNDTVSRSTLFSLRDPYTTHTSWKHRRRFPSAFSLSFGPHLSLTPRPCD